MYVFLSSFIFLRYIYICVAGIIYTNSLTVFISTFQFDVILTYVLGFCLFLWPGGSNLRPHTIGEYSLPLSYPQLFNTYSVQLKDRCRYISTVLMQWFISVLSSSSVNWIWFLLLCISKVNEAYAYEFTGYWTSYSYVFEECFCHTLLSQQPSTNRNFVVCFIRINKVTYSEYCHSKFCLPG